QVDDALRLRLEVRQTREPLRSAGGFTQQRPESGKAGTGCPEEMPASEQQGVFTDRVHRRARWWLLISPDDGALRPVPLYFTRERLLPKEGRFATGTQSVRTGEPGRVSAGRSRTGSPGFFRGGRMFVATGPVGPALGGLGRLEQVFLDEAA